MTNRLFLTLTSALATTLGATVLPMAAQAAEAATAADTAGQLEEVVVTAERFAATVQTTPVAITALSPTTLEQRQVNNVLQAAQQIPGIVITPATGTSTSARIVLRGAGQEQSGILADPAVGVYIDNVYQPRINGSFFDFFDIDRLEVLRGPQGTLYGRNTSGGAIKIYTKRPTFEPSASGDIAAGTYKMFDARGLVSGPIVPGKLAASISAVSRHRGGFIDGPAYGRKVDNKKLTAVRGKLLFTPVDKVEVELAYDIMKDRSDPGVGVVLQAGSGVVAPLAVPGRDLTVTELFGPIQSKVDSQGGSINASYDVSPTVRLTSITGYRLLRNQLITPLWLSAAAQAANNGILNFGTSTRLRSSMWSQEVNGTLTTDRIKGVVGAYLFAERGRNLLIPPYTAPSGLANQYRYTDASALFGQATVNVTQKLGLTAGVRYTHEHVDFTQFYYNQLPKPQSDSRTFNAWSPKFGIDYQATETLLAYVSYTRGFKSGSFNAVAPLTNTGIPGVAGGPTPYDPETVGSYEAGVKYTTPDRRMRLNAAVFEADYKGLQLPVFFPGTSNSYTSNATGAKIQGIELEPTWQALDSLQIYGIMSFERGHYTGPLVCSLANTSISNCQGKRIKGLVPAKVIIGFVFSPDLNIPGQLRLVGDYDHSDAYFNNVANEIALVQTPKTDIFNGSASWDSPDGHWTVSLEGRNIFNKHYVLAGLQLASAVRPSVTGYPGEPRTVDVRVRAKF